jgi:hypothetical protein
VSAARRAAAEARETQADEEDQTHEEGEAGEEARVEEGRETLTMQVRENWSHVVGRVETWTPPKDADDHGELVVRVERVEEVKEEAGKAYPNLMEKAEGTTLRVRVPASAAATLDVPDGASITVDVRRGREAGLVFANPEKIRIRS